MVSVKGPPCLWKDNCTIESDSLSRSRLMCYDMTVAQRHVVAYSLLSCVMYTGLVHNFVLMDPSRVESTLKPNTITTNDK